MISATESLQRLRDGNRRYVANEPRNSGITDGDRQAVADGQSPFAIILGCSDSRVPAEIVFDQGLGDLFVVRVAGNVVEPTLLGSIEFAATKFGSRLIVVLGHSGCGAVEATLQEIRQPSEDPSPNVAAIVELIQPSVAPLLNDGDDESDAVFARAVRENVKASAARLRSDSTIIERLEREDGLVIVAAEYSLETGQVDFFDGVP